MNVSLIKYGMVVVTMPVWLPFVRTLWLALKDCLAEDGGFFGQPPGPRGLEELRRKREEDGDPLIHEPYFSGQRASFPAGQGKGSQGSQGKVGPGRGAPRPATPSTRGFRRGS